MASPRKETVKETAFFFIHPLGKVFSFILQCIIMDIELFFNFAVQYFDTILNSVVKFFDFLSPFFLDFNYLLFHLLWFGCYFCLSFAPS